MRQILSNDRQILSNDVAGPLSNSSICQISSTREAPLSNPLAELSSHAHLPTESFACRSLTVRPEEFIHPVGARGLSTPSPRLRLYQNTPVKFCPHARPPCQIPSKLVKFRRRRGPPCQIPSKPPADRGAGCPPRPHRSACFTRRTGRRAHRSEQPTGRSSHSGSVQRLQQRVSKHASGWRPQPRSC